VTIDDPFAADGDEGDRTIIRPAPGGRRAGPSPPPSPPPPPPRSPSPAAAESAPVSAGVGLNPLEAAAAPLLSLIMRLKNTHSHPDPERLRRRMIEEMKAFTVNARNAGIHEKTVFRARYVLCTTLDEVVLNTPWGRASEWSENSLLITFHNETWGGEKFFELLDAILPDPRKHLHLLELMYLCLAFGFQGRYRLLDNGRSRLDEQRERTYNAIRTAHGEYERELSPHWRGRPQPTEPADPLRAAVGGGGGGGRFAAARLRALQLAAEQRLRPSADRARRHSRGYRGHGPPWRRDGGTLDAKTAGSQRSQPGLARLAHFSRSRRFGRAWSMSLKMPTKRLFAFAATACSTRAAPTSNRLFCRC
jgi:type IV/VI secretion system ImpK/VasF family protein